MNTKLIFLWFITLLPIVISPGPANILYAASGSSFGIKKTVPFWLGTNITSIFQTLTIGFCLNFIISIYPNTISIIKYIGILFLLYLAFKFFKMSTALKERLKPLTFKDGVIIEVLNTKYLMIPAIMFSQFYKPETGGYAQVLILTFALVSLTLTTSMIWIIGGKSLALLVSKKNTQRTQGLFFGTLLCLTAFWLLIR